MSGVTEEGLRNPWSGRWSRRIDVGLVVALMLPVLPLPFVFGMATSTYVLSALQILPLLVRRTSPTLCFLAVSALMVLQLPFTDTPIWGQVAMPVAVHAMAAYAPRRHATAALGVGLVGAVVGPLDWYVFETGLTSGFLMIMLTALLVIAPWSLGMWSRTRRAYVESLIDRGRRLELEAAQQAELAASDERARIAREMHDVVAHGLSVIIVQADGARYAVKGSPEAAADALETIAATGRESLGEMRRMLGLLRSEDTETGTRPQPGLQDLDYLVEQSRAAGMTLDASVEDPLPEVSSSVGLTVYRVAQEALTNVRKHAGPDVSVRLSVRCEPASVLPVGEAVVVDVEDDGRGAAATDDGTGHGLIGMRERCAVHGGRLEAGPRPGGGYRVHASIPLAEPGGRE